MQQKTSLNLGADGRETVVRGTLGFPCAAYFTDISLYPAKRVPWHWHEEIELSMVVGGTARVLSPDGKRVIRKGGGMFVNAGAMHAVEIVGGEGCRLISLILDYSMLAGREDGVFSRRYVQPLVSSHAVRILSLDAEVDWQKAALALLREAFLIYDEGRFGFELLVRAKLTECLWYIVSNTRAAMRAYEEVPEQAEERVKNMLDFIHTHYAEPIQLADIALAANIGERECLRSFQKTLGVSPTAYLLRYRISMSAQLLINTDTSVAEVCFAVGFNSQSHFGQLFKRNFHMTPREYRANYSRALRTPPATDAQ